LQLEDGLQPLEAMLYTLEQINKDTDLLPGIKLGMIAFDSCDSPSYGLEQALDFVKGMKRVTDLKLYIVTDKNTLVFHSLVQSLPVRNQ
jgi:hypothetical protein